MFFILSKTLAFLTSPFTYLFGLIVWILITKKDKRRKKLIKIVFFFLFIFGNNFILDEFVRLWEPAVEKLEYSEYDIGIVLGGMINYDASNDIIRFNSNADRLLQALPLLKNGTIETLLFSGGSGDIYHPENKESLILERYLKTINIKTENWIFETKSRNTYENALFSKNKLKEIYGDLSNKKILLITSSRHMRRSISCFEAQGIEVNYLSTNRYVGDRKFEFEHCLIPSIVVLASWNHLLHELCGYFSYWLTGKI